MTLSLTYSPCPNDTFVFHALAHGLVDGAPEVDVTYRRRRRHQRHGRAGRARHHQGLVRRTAVVAGRVRAAAHRRCAGAWLRAAGADRRAHRPAWRDRRRTRRAHHRLPAVPAVGCRPGRRHDRPSCPSPRSCRPSATAWSTPGWSSTRRGSPTGRYGLTSLVDLGDWWESDTGLPIPLGAILARRSLDLPALTAAIRTSVELAWHDPAASAAYVAEHADEMDPDVQQRHIALYVNEFTRDLGADGYAAVEALLGRAAAAGLVPPVDPALLH